MNYYSIKLKSGELFACQSPLELDTRSLMNKAWIELEYPVQFVNFRFADQDTGEIIETVSMAPLVPTSEDRLLTISTDSIILIASLRAAAVEKYCSFIERMVKHIEQGGENYAEDIDTDPEQTQAELQEMLAQLDTTDKIVH